MLSPLERVLFVLALASALTLAGRELFRKYRLIHSGQKVNRLDKPLARIVQMLYRVIFQGPVFSQRPLTGFFHAMIFWGFLVFLLVTINHVVEGFSQGVHLYGLGFLLQLLTFAANLFAALILLAVLYFFVRRYLFRVSSLDRPSWQSLIVLSFIFLLMISFVYYEALKMYSAAGSRANFLAHWAFSLLFPPAHAVSFSAVLFWQKFLWWLHILLVMAFGVFILYSKHLHLLAGPINLLFRQTGVKAEIPLLNLEAQEKFGAVNVTDLTRKDLLDLFSCAECGRCDDVCPAFTSGKALSPKSMLHKLKEHLLDSEKIIRSGGQGLKTLFADVVSEEEIWDCTQCAACMEVCPMLNEHVAKIVGMRQHGVMMLSRFPEEFQTLYRGLENQGNPWGINADTRSDWAKDLQIPRLADKGETDILLWVGCAGSFDAHSQRIVRALVQIMQRAQLDFAFLGNEERCCGDAARRTGMEYLFQMLAQQNIATLNRYRFQRIVTICPHGLHVLGQEYASMGGKYQVLHHSQLLCELLAAGKLRCQKSAALFAYHDPCFLGRYSGSYDDPRQVLCTCTEKSLREMPRRRQTSFCCGAGGGGMWKEEKSGQRISQVRLRQAQETGAGLLVTACPFCSIMFKDAIDETATAGLRTQDLAQVMWESLSD